MEIQGHLKKALIWIVRTNCSHIFSVEEVVHIKMNFEIQRFLIKKNGFIKNSVALVLTRNDHNIFRILKASHVNVQFVVFAFRFTALLSHSWVARFILLSHRNTFLTYKVCLHSFRISNYAIWALLARCVFYCVMRPVRISSMFSPAYVMYVVYRSHYNRKLFKMILNDKWIEIRRLMVW